MDARLEKRYERVQRFESKPLRQEQMKQNLPLKKFKVGGISATVWENHSKNDQGQIITYKTVGFERSYKDDKGDWQTTNALRSTDLPKAILVLNKAYEFLAFEANAEE